MKTRHALFLILALAAGNLSHAKEEGSELTPYSIDEAQSYLDAFLRDYKKKTVTEDDAIAVLGDLKNAYRYFASKGDARTKAEIKMQKTIVKSITKGLKARKRPRVTLECVRVLGEIGDPAAAKDVTRWLEKVLDEKSVIPEWVEFGYKSMAWIGSTKKNSIELIMKYGTGKHTDESVPAFAMEGAIQYRRLPGKLRKEMFNKLAGWMQGLYSSAKGGDPKKRATFEKRYDAVKVKGMLALGELASYDYLDDLIKFKEPNEAMAWFKEHKNKKWPDYVGPRFRPKPAKKEGDKKDGDKKDDEKPAG